MASVWRNFWNWVTGTVAVPIRAGTATAWRAEREDGGTVYHGAFAVRDAVGNELCFQGRVVEKPGRLIEVYVRDPPANLKRHPKGGCFQLLAPGGPWFKVHWDRPPQNGEVGRTYVEQILAEVVSGKCG